MEVQIKKGKEIKQAAEHPVISDSVDMLVRFHGSRLSRECPMTWRYDVTYMNDLVRTQKGRNEETCVFINSQNAFDDVKHEFLWYKLLDNGVTRKMFYCIKSVQ